MQCVSCITYQMNLTHNLGSELQQLKRRDNITVNIFSYTELF